MDLNDLARRDMQFITGTPGGFAVVLEFTAPDDSTATIYGRATRHNMGLDTEGNIVNTRNVSCSFAEDLLSAEDYPVRTGGEVLLKGHKVAWTDATGVKKTYIIESWMPDETLGLIVCKLGTYTS